MPTPAPMRTESMRWTRRLAFLLGLNYWKYLNILSSRVELSRYDEELGLPHPPTVSLGEDKDTRFTDEGEGKRRWTLLPDERDSLLHFAPVLRSLSAGTIRASGNLLRCALQADLFYCRI
jgi:hypothetical protein